MQKLSTYINPIDEAAHVQIHLFKMTPDKLLLAAIKHHNAKTVRFDPNAEYQHSFPLWPAVNSLRDQIVVNYVRHNLCDEYNVLSERWKYLPDEQKSKALELLRRKVYAAISEVYPFLAAECKKQYHLKLSVDQRQILAARARK